MSDYLQAKRPTLHLVAPVLWLCRAEIAHRRCAEGFGLELSRVIAVPPNASTASQW